MDGNIRILPAGVTLITRNGDLGHGSAKVPLRI